MPREYNYALTPGERPNSRRREKREEEFEGGLDKTHREDVKAAVRAAVKVVLRKRGVTKERLDTLTDKLIVQAEAMFRDWPLAA